ncbi:MAG: vWA domain-containing protein [Gammaproteobacteria bacterium]
MSRLPLSVALTALLGCGSASFAASDVRILIDVSGSMQKNDPANLRIPALKLLTELLPVGTTAGVWLFDSKAEVLVPTGTVDSVWKETARAAANRVHSQGEFTHIEAALEAGAEGWPLSPNAATPRHVILLTDGVVDVGQDPKASETSRTRLLTDGLARFRAQGVRINAVALSDQADRTLLKALADGTDGWFDRVDDAATLHRVFLHLFEQTAAPDALPLVGNTFTVDDKVKELTLLVFHPGDAPSLELTDPNGAVWTVATAHADSAWQHEAGYDLVTLSAPHAGTWSFNAAADPDNRALIVTDLALALNDLPVNAMPGESLPITAQLLEQGAPLMRPDFLQLIKADAALIDSNHEAIRSELALDVDLGHFAGSATMTDAPGDYRLVVRIDGGTFQREQHRRLKVNGPPFAFSTDPLTTETDGRVIHLTIAADTDVVNPATFTGLLELTTPHASTQVLDLPALDGSEITLELGAEYRGDYILQPWVFAETRAARPIRVKPDPITVSFGDGLSLAPQAPADAPPAPPPDLAWAEFATVVAIGNLSVGSVLGGLWCGLRRRAVQLPVL